MTPDGDVASVEDLFLQHRVDLVLSGHIHAVSVTKPVYNGQIVNASTPGAYDAPIYGMFIMT